MRFGRSQDGVMSCPQFCPRNMLEIYSESAKDVNAGRNHLQPFPWCCTAVGTIEVLSSKYYAWESAKMLWLEVTDTWIWKFICSCTRLTSTHEFVGGSLDPTYSTFSMCASSNHSQAHPHMSVCTPEVQASASNEDCDVHRVLTAEELLHNDIDL